MPPSVFRTKNNRGRRFIFGELGHRNMFLKKSLAKVESLGVRVGEVDVAAKRASDIHVGGRCHTGGGTKATVILVDDVGVHIGDAVAALLSLYDVGVGLRVGAAAVVEAAETAVVEAIGLEPVDEVEYRSSLLEAAVVVVVASPVEPPVEPSSLWGRFTHHQRSHEDQHEQGPT